ncbi:exported hypothetical protein [Paraburkholderia caribensis]|nr:exported hypothetical protein [Paraburkholderia caribensis]
MRHGKCSRCSLVLASPFDVLASALGLRGAGGSDCLCFRWHPLDVIGASGVAPVRGGTYFSLPPQGKVGKRKRLTPPILVPA